MGKLEIINAALAAGHLSTRDALAAAGADNAGVMIPCEAPGCPNVVPRSHAYSLAAVYRSPGYQRNAYQCAGEQHWGCTHEHACIALVHCLDQHILAGPFNPVPHASVSGQQQQAQVEPAQIVEADAPASNTDDAAQSGV